MNELIWKGGAVAEKKQVGLFKTVELEALFV